MLYLRAQCPGHRIVLLGTGPEYRLNEELIAAARIPDVCNAADDLPIPRLVALLSRAAGLVTVDSGPAHAAAAVGMSSGGAVRARFADALPARGERPARM